MSCNASITSFIKGLLNIIFAAQGGLAVQKGAVYSREPASFGCFLFEGRARCQKARYELRLKKSARGDEILANMSELLGIRAWKLSTCGSRPPEDVH